MATSSSIPAGATPEGDGIVVGGGPVRVDAYIDFLCPYCRKFEQSSGPALDRLVADGRITLVYHPVSFLDRLSAGTRYSTRAAAAAGSASDVGGFLPLKDALFASQPDEGGPGLTDEQIVALARDAGVVDPGFAERVAEGRYLDWSASVTEAAVERGVNGIPTVFLAGERVDPYGTAIAEAVAAAGR